MALKPAVQKAIYEAVDHPGYGILPYISHWIGGQEGETLGDQLAARSMAKRRVLG